MRTPNVLGLLLKSVPLTILQKGIEQYLSNFSRQLPPLPPHHDDYRDVPATRKESRASLGLTYDVFFVSRVGEMRQTLESRPGFCDVSV